MALPLTLGELKKSKDHGPDRLSKRSVKDELRENLMRRLKGARTEPLFPGIVGYEDTVVPQVVNA
ncbi:MAG TPA: magnesium chelatase, partial [Terriglobales bacterium]